MFNSSNDGNEGAGTDGWAETPFSTVDWNHLDNVMQEQLRGLLKTELGDSPAGSQLADLAEITKYQIYDPNNGVVRPPQVEGPLTERVINPLNEQLQQMLQIEYGVPEYEASNTFIEGIRATTNQQREVRKGCMATCDDGVRTSVPCSQC